MRIYDISLPVDGQLAGWPGDTPYRFNWTCRISDGSSVNLGEVGMSIHTGTHIDAPLHVRDHVPSMEGVDLSAFIGPAIVADVTGIPTIEVKDIHLAIAGRDLREAPRLLLKTGGWIDHGRFPETIPTLALDVPDWLGSFGLRLIGFDVPSVDQIDSKNLPIHNALINHGISILESLNLSDVAPGAYELIALPLRLVGADGSPVRAILRDLMTP